LSKGLDFDAGRDRIFTVADSSDRWPFVLKTMTASKENIVHWLIQAKMNKTKYLVIGHDTFYNENFPIYCESGKECLDALTRLFQSGNRYDEVYDMSLSIEDQLAERRAIHLPPRND